MEYDCGEDDCDDMDFSERCDDGLLSDRGDDLWLGNDDGSFMNLCFVLWLTERLPLNGLNMFLTYGLVAPAFIGVFDMYVNGWLGVSEYGSDVVE